MINRGISRNGLGLVHCDSEPSEIVETSVIFHGSFEEQGL